jgi:transcriptional regulator with XRE-family HTH domain
MPSQDHKKRTTGRTAEMVGQRLRSILENTAVSVFAKRVGVSRQWLHDILSGKIPPESSIGTLSSIADTMGYNLDWLVTGKGMPSDKWTEQTTLLPRLAVQKGARGAAALKIMEGETVLISSGIMNELHVARHSVGVALGSDVGLSAGSGGSDELLVDLDDRKLTEGGLFLVQVRGQILVRRALATEEGQWLLSSEGLAGSVGSVLSTGYKVIGRIRFIWKRL